MEERKNKEREVIDLREVFGKIWSNRRLFYKVLPIVFVLSCIYIFSVPRYYTSEVRLAPELGGDASGGALSSIASSFGFDLDEVQTADAITPLLYPDLMDDNGFVYSLMNIRVKDQDGEIEADYHDYLKFHQKKAWWFYPISWVKSLLPKPEDKGGSKGGYDPYNLSESEESVYALLRLNVTFSVDKKTGVIAISTKAQDPLVARTLADSVQQRLQVFITKYRTNKARIDYEYYKALTDSAKREYDVVRRKYALKADANTHISLKSATLMLEDIGNDMSQKYTTYTSLNSQLQAAQAKVQERTPAFTVIKRASVSTRPAGPKRMIFVAAMLIFSFMCTALYIFMKQMGKGLN
jgi:uncharacterized protein involved in exopolysaccharide biosynthesis